MNKIYSAAIFDLDGTLLNTLKDLHSSVNYALKAFSYPLRSEEEVKGFVGNGIKRLISLAVPYDGADKEGVYKVFMRHYIKHCNDNTEPYPGIDKTLKALEERGVKTAIVSNKNHVAVEELRRIYFPSVSVSIGEDEENGIRKKPFPDSVNRAIELLGARREDCVYIGDSEVDILTAKNSSLSCLSVTWGFRDRDFLIKNGAETLVDSAEDLLKFF